MVDIRTLQKVLGFIVQPILSIIGLFANILCLVVLKKKGFHNSTSIYLQALAICGILVIVIQASEIFRYVPGLLTNYNTRVVFTNYTVYIRFPFGNLFIVATAWITVAVSMERCVVVRNPIRGRQICTRKSAYIICASITIISALVNGPRFIQFVPNYNVNRTKYVDLNTDSNGTILIDKLYEVSITVIGTIIPFLIVLLNNMFILATMCIHWKNSAALSANNELTNTRQIRNNIERRSITMMVIATTTIFLLCESLSVYCFMVLSVYGNNEGYKILFRQQVIFLNNIFVLANSCFCSALYMGMSRNFRRTAIDLICRRSRQQPNESNCSPDSLKYGQMGIVPNSTVNFKSVSQVKRSEIVR